MLWCPLIYKIFGKKERFDYICTTNGLFSDMKARIKNFFNLIAGAILSLLGFSGCDLLGFITPRAEYGMPHADYKLIGSVDGTDGPLEGIEVKYRHKMGTFTDENGTEKEEWREESFHTDKKGLVNAPLSDYDAWMKSEDLQIVLTDVDGHKNGLYDRMVLDGNDIDISFQEDKKGNWHTGSYTIGFAARMKEIIEMPAEYGMPHAEYRIIGTVKDAKGNPIPGIEVLTALWHIEGDDQSQGPIIATQTATDGRFTAITSEFPGFNIARLTLNDIDGSENGGEFKSGEAAASFSQTSQGNGHWDEGTFEADAGDIVLKK